MKYYVFLFCSIFLLLSCVKPSDCIESSGAIVSKEIMVLPYTRLEVSQGIEVVITQGATYKTQIEAGENFIDNIEVYQEGNTLFLKEKSACNWVRDYGQTKVYITTPNLQEIYSKTDRKISSTGVLTFPSLTIIAVDKNGDGKEGSGTGDFFLNITNDQLVIVNNSLSRYYLSGTTKQFTIGIYNGDGRIEAQNFLADNCYLYHRGSNDVVVSVNQKMEGKLVSTGNLILKKTPAILSVEELYLGRILYN
jgi:Putative auto-transporter adhesin, head GIN domain